MDKSEIKHNIQDNHKALQSSRYQKSGLTMKKCKLSSRNFDKLMEKRGLSKNQTESLKASFSKDQKLQVRHAKKGEKFIVTHGEQNASGVFVSEKSLGNTPGERIDKGSLPHSNSAKYETKVNLDRDQNLIYGQIAPQTKFQKMDVKQMARSGGGVQVVTDGGYEKGAIRNLDSKYPSPMENSNLTKSQSFKKSLEVREKTKSSKEAFQKNQKNNRGPKLH